MRRHFSPVKDNAVLLYAPCSLQLVTQCSSQSGTLILGNKPIILRESYRQRLPVKDNAVLLYAPCSLQLVTQCSSQSGTLILGNKPIILRESYRQRLLSLCVMILVTLSKETLSLELNIVVKNKSKVVQPCLYSYRQRYSPSQWSKFVVDSTCFAS